MFEVPSLEEMPEDLRSRIKEVAEKSGFVPNIFLTLARRPPSGGRSSPTTMR